MLKMQQKLLSLITFQWESIDGTMKWISSGKDILVGVDRNNEVYYRSGMSSANPKGEKWVKVSGSLAQIEVDGLQTVGVNGNGEPFQSGASRGRFKVDTSVIFLCSPNCNSL